MKPLHLSLLLLFCFTATASYCSSCNEPILQNFGIITSTSAEINFIDVNGGLALEWEVELLNKGESPTGMPTAGSIMSSNYIFTGLDAGTEYSFYLRAICAKGPSDWNGPYSFFTSFINGQSCNVDVGIKDEDCTNYLIEVENLSSELGNTIFVEEVKLSIAHSWPQDLVIELTSPNGKTVLLSERNGVNSDHYGDPFDVECNTSINFNNKACLSVDEIQPPLIGTFKPEGDINIFLDGSNPNGIWTLKICDEAKPDIGNIQYVEIEFSEEICPVPSIFVVKNIDDTSAQIQWSPPFNCIFLEAVWGEIGFDPNFASVFTVGCQAGDFPISNLQPNTTYEVYVKSKCNLADSPFSCSLIFTTECAAATNRFNFDLSPLCQTSCIEECAIFGNWRNIHSDDQDWLVHQGETPTTFTGPDNDAFEFGRYIYIENAPTVCDSGAVAQLRSKCIEIDPNSPTCTKLKFAYHMYGLGVNSLSLQLSEDQGQNWIYIFLKEGNQLNRWIFEEIDLSEYAGKQVILSFEASSGSAEGDIALDQIELFGAQFIDDGQLYFIDNDMDGFGSTDTIRHCGIPYLGISLNSLDCNDHDATINPDASELPCNLIDENCNGNMDDPIQSNPTMYTIDHIDHETCFGIADGQIDLSFFDGTPPYSVQWNNGFTGNNIGGLTKGIYYATITDGTGCKIQTEFIEITANTELQLFSSLHNPPSCPGKSDGEIAFSVTGGVAPYSFLWSNMSQDSIATNLTEGHYSVVISDANGCFLQSEEVILDAPEAIVAGVQFQRDVDCFGNNTGEITLGFTQAEMPIDVTWNTGQTGTSVSNLFAGNYQCTITDANGCQLILPDIEVTQNDSLRIFVEGVENVRCHGESDGKIEITVLGGYNPYSYNWNNGAFTEDLFNIPKGSYVLNLTDFRGCDFQSDTILISEPNPISISVDTIDLIACPFSANGEISLEVDGGTTPYNYFWDHTLVDTNQLTNLNVGSYGLNIIDAFNCKASIDTLEISAINEPLLIDINLEENNMCFGDSLGIVSTQANSLRFPLDFNWSSGIQNVHAQNIDTIFNLPNGSFNVTVTDNEGCVGISTIIELSSPDRIEYTVINTEDLLCYQDSTGAITISVQGGIEPYIIDWDHGDSGQTLEGLAAGIYTFEIIDSNSCQITGNQIEIIEPEPLILDATITNDNNSQGVGKIEIDPDGGVPFYFYSWSANANTLNEAVANMLNTDTYLLTLQDANNCTLDTSFFVDNISAVENQLLDENNLIKVLEGNIEIDLSENSVISIFDIGGRMFKKNKFQKGRNRISISDYPSGIYFIKIDLNDQRFVKKVLITN